MAKIPLNGQYIPAKLLQVSPRGRATVEIPGRYKFRYTISFGNPTKTKVFRYSVGRAEFGWEELKAGSPDLAGCTEPPQEQVELRLPKSMLIQKLNTVMPGVILARAHYERQQQRQLETAIGELVAEEDKEGSGAYELQPPNPPQ